MDPLTTAVNIAILVASSVFVITMLVVIVVMLSVYQKISKFLDGVNNVSRIANLFSLSGKSVTGVFKSLTKFVNRSGNKQVASNE